MLSRSDRRRTSGLPLVCLLAILGTTVMAALDAFDWFYRHSRRHEAYDYDEIVAFMSLFMMVGMLVLSLRERKRALGELARRIESDEQLERLNRELECRIQERTAELEIELDERRLAEGRLDESQQQLRRLSAELTQAEERERRRIAAELHDNIGQSLAIASNRIGQLKAKESVGTLEGALGEIGDRIDEAIRYSRSLIFELSSPLTDLLPFASAVSWLAEDVLRDQRIALNVVVEGEPEFPVGDARALFILAIREVLVNIVKHARASSVQISVRRDEDHVVVYVADDGVGFDLGATGGAAVPAGLGFGLRTVADRLEQLSGDVSVQSRLGRGTWVRLKAPMPEHETGGWHGDQHRPGGRPHDLPAGHSGVARAARRDAGDRGGRGRSDRRRPRP